MSRALKTHNIYTQEAQNTDTLCVFNSLKLNLKRFIPETKIFGLLQDFHMDKSGLVFYFLYLLTETHLVWSFYSLADLGLHLGGRVTTWTHTHTQITGFGWLKPCSGLWVNFFVPWPRHDTANVKWNRFIFACCKRDVLYINFHIVVSKSEEKHSEVPLFILFSV